MKELIELNIRGAVANYNENEYEGFYPNDGGYMKFGTSGIDLDDAIRFVLTQTKMNDLILKLKAIYS